MAKATHIGSSHEKQKKSCQDAVYSIQSRNTRTICKIKNRLMMKQACSFTGISLADGAGSSVYSDIGAQHITKSILQKIERDFNWIYNNIVAEKFLLDFVENEIKNLALQHCCAIKDLSSTLLFVCIKFNKCIVGHIGDGVIGVLRKNNNTVDVLSYPKNGEFANSTFFTTSTDFNDRLRLFMFNLKDELGFILLSDGSSESLYDKKNMLLSQAVYKIINMPKNYSNHESILNNEVMPKIASRTDDDCSIAIIRSLS
ncbi:PP2C family serine/threonine-protein phosphatase [Campylobacter sp. RM15925]|uniref:PP2C family serine/threonine-protein phosphatase n=1 Tax=Campylobacter sp. RM15925 TaxID=1705724 RepID=UPI0014746221